MTQNATPLHQVFARAPVLQIVSPRGRQAVTIGSPIEGAELAPTASFVEGGAMASLKIVKIGVLSRKEDAGKKSKWRSWSVILTGSQLLFFVRRLSPRRSCR